jgi:mannose-6-phosphate isomerase-like protein (cupin superfamily)
LTGISVAPALQQKRPWGKSVRRSFGALAIFFIIPASIAQERSPYVINTASMQEILAKSSDPNSFSELTKGSGFRLTLRRRTQRDVANRHDSRVEVYHILDGSATLTTGGHLRSPSKDEGKGNWKGEGIEGGTSTSIQKGAVVVIEPGLPHWFSDIKGSITYTTTWIYR